MVVAWRAVEVELAQYTVVALLIVLVLDLEYFVAACVNIVVEELTMDLVRAVLVDTAAFEIVV